MIRIIRYEGQPVETLLNRAFEPGRDVTDTVSAILEDVRARGDEAVLDYCEKFRRHAPAKPAGNAGRNRRRHGAD